MLKLSISSWKYQKLFIPSSIPLQSNPIKLYISDSFLIRRSNYCSSFPPSRYISQRQATRQMKRKFIKINGDKRPMLIAYW